MSVDTLKAAQSFLRDQVLQVKSEDDLQEMIEARCYYAACLVYYCKTCIRIEYFLSFFDRPAARSWNYCGRIHLKKLRRRLPESVKFHGRRILLERRKHFLRRLSKLKPIFV